MPETIQENWATQYQVKKKKNTIAEEYFSTYCWWLKMEYSLEKILRKEKEDEKMYTRGGELKNVLWLNRCSQNFF